MDEHRQGLMISNIPEDINAEVLLSYEPMEKCAVSFVGLHKRNAYNDIIETEEDYTGRTHISIGRNSIYNSLPEYMFHPIDRFDNLPQYEEKERFREQIDEQEKEKEDAFRFFAPIDIMLFQQRIQVRKKMEALADGNVIMEKILGDRLTDSQLQNRFIRPFVRFLPQCKNIRGNKTLLTILLRKILMDEGLHVEIRHITELKKDDHPRYADSVDMELGEGYVGNQYYEPLTVYEINYWSEDECSDDFMKFVSEMDELRLFLQDWFLAVDEELRFDISHDEIPLRLSDEVFRNYLNYNTNI